MKSARCWWLLACFSVSLSGNLHGQPTREFDFNLPAQPLTRSLHDFSTITGIATLGQTELLERRMAVPVIGRLTVSRALDRMLGETDLRYQFASANAVAIFRDERPHPLHRGLPRAAEEQPAVDLEKFEVIGRRSSAGDYSRSRSHTATKTDTALIDVPQAVTVITRDLIDDQSMRSMADVVRYIPGIGIAQGEGNRDTIVLRGSSSSASFYVDGLRDDIDYFRDFYNVERIEALKGPNAMIFGRGGPGGLINRVTKQPNWTPFREIKVEAGSWNAWRGTLDAGLVASDHLALRFNGLFEDAGSYRHAVTLQRYGLNPTAVIQWKPETSLRFGYEHFRDRRVNDRGVPSFGGRPLATSPSTFFGDPEWNDTTASVDSSYFVVEHQTPSGLVFRNATSFSSYGKYYQNVLPTTVSADGSQVELIAYSSDTGRQQFLNQSEVVLHLESGQVKHDLLMGLELGRQDTDNRRERGFFTGEGPDVSSLFVPVLTPTVHVPIALRQRDNDVTNHGTAESAALYLQNQISFSAHWLAIAGLRFESLDVNFTNDRTGMKLTAHDRYLSPRAGLIYKPMRTLSVYASFTRAYLPRAGERLSSLTLNNQALEPEIFENQEIGAKWDFTPDTTAMIAAYQLDRRKVEVADVADPARSVLVDGQQVRGIEAGVSGKLAPHWSVMGGYAYQAGEIKTTLSPTILAGSRVPQLPRHTVSCWSRYDFAAYWGAAVGIIYRDDLFASTDNRVTLPGFTRVDVAGFFRLPSHVRAQLNIENVLDRTYHSMAHNNSNIMPGAPRSFRLSVTKDF